MHVKRVCLYVEACVSDLSRPSHISRSVAFVPSHFPSRTVNDLVGRCSRCSKVAHTTRARSRFYRVFATDRFKKERRKKDYTSVAKFYPRNRKPVRCRAITRTFATGSERNEKEKSSARDFHEWINPTWRGLRRLRFIDIVNLRQCRNPESRTFVFEQLLTRHFRHIRFFYIMRLSRILFQRTRIIYVRRFREGIAKTRS